MKLRYKAPDGDDEPADLDDRDEPPAAMTANLGFASAVAEFGMLLRARSTRGPRATTAVARARKFRQDDPDGYRAEFIRLAELAAGLQRLDATARR